MNFYIFYVTHKFLERVTEESYAHPYNLLDTPHYGLYFKLLKYKVITKREILYIPTSLFRLFKGTKHFKNFMGNQLLRGVIKKDDTIFEEDNKKEMHIIECANYKSGEGGESEVCIICCDDEHKEIKEKMDEKGYAFKCLKIDETKEMLKGI